MFSSLEKETGKSKAYEDVTSISSPTETLPPYEARDGDEAGLPVGYQSPIPELLPHPAKLLTIHARGTSAMHCSRNELVMPIFAGTDVTTEPLYVSTRAKKSSNSCILSHRTKGDIVSTTYRIGFGKSRQPKIRFIQNGACKGLSDEEDEGGPVALQASTNGWTNATTMVSEINPNQVLTWKYTKTPTIGRKLRVMALYAESVSSSSSKSDKGLGEPIAVLVRSDGTRTPGTSKWDGGNGGQLLLSGMAAGTVDEGLIVASCIMCLKKENDRQRNAMAAAVA